jgi:hypothetical protein
MRRERLRGQFLPLDISGKVVMGAFFDILMGCKLV